MNSDTLACHVLLAPALLPAQGSGVSPADLLKPLKDSWPTYNGDYSGKRYSALTQVNRSNVKHLTLAWMSRVTPGAGNTERRLRGGRGGGGGVRTSSSGGEGTGDLSAGGGTIKASVLEVDGILYFTMPDNAWAMDAQRRPRAVALLLENQGRHAHRQSRPRDVEQLSVHGNARRLPGFARRQNRQGTLAQSRSPIWTQGYFSTPAPIVIGNHVIVGTGNDIDAPGFLQSFDPETGELQWKLYTVPMQKGDPGLDTWASLDAARHGGAQTWIPGAYDPETKLYIFGTGNPTPAYTTGTRGEGDNLFTCALVAVNVDTGKMAWYFQTSPHDMHDYDSAQTPVLVDAHVQRQNAEAGADGGAQRILLYAGSRDRRAPGDQQVRHAHQLGQGPEQVRRPAARSRKDRHRGRLAGIAELGRHHELGTARLLSGHRPVLCRRGQRVLDLLPDRPGSARLDGAGRQGRSAASARAAVISRRSITGRARWSGGIATTATAVAAVC